MIRTNAARFQAVVDTIALVIVAAAVGKIAFGPSVKTSAAKAAGQVQATALLTAPVSLDGAQLQGSRSAKVALLVYSDFECPFCGKFARETFPVIVEKYVQTGRLLVGFRHFPLPMHQFAERAAEVAECVGHQNKFWTFHDRLFAAGAKLSEEALRTGVADVGVDAASVERCVIAEGREAVAASKESGAALGVTGTPTFFIGRVQGDAVEVTERLTGALPVEQFEEALARAGVK